MVSRAVETSNACKKRKSQADQPQLAMSHHFSHHQQKRQRRSKNDKPKKVTRKDIWWLIICS